MRKILLLAGCLFFPLLSGCDYVDNYIDKRIEAGSDSQKIAALQKELEETQKSLKYFEESQKLTYKYIIGPSLSRVEEVAPSSAYLDPNTNKFSVVGYRGCFLTVSCTKFKEYGSGSTVTLELVNLMAASLTNVEVKVEYGPDAELKTGLPNETSSRIGLVRSGASNIVEIRMPEYKPEQVKYFSVSVEIGGIEYRVGK